MDLNNNNNNKVTEGNDKVSGLSLLQGYGDDNDDDNNSNGK